MEKTIVGTFNDVTAAMNTLPDFVRQGIPSEQISIVTPDSEDEFARYLSTRGERPIVEDAGIGAVVGGIGGLLVGLAVMTVPGIGPVLAAGPLSAALAGAMVGAETGSLIAALHGQGVAEYEAKSHAERVGEGATLVIVKADEALTEQAMAVLQRHHATKMEQHPA